MERALDESGLKGLGVGNVIERLQVLRPDPSVKILEIDYTTKSADESRAAYDLFENYIRFIRRFADVQFITASEAARIWSTLLVSATASFRHHVARSSRKSVILSRPRCHSLTCRIRTNLVGATN